MSERPARAGARGRPGSPRARLFLALDLPADTRAEIVAWRERALAGRPAVRPLRAEALHVTLVFLGYRPEKEIATIAEAAFSATAACAAARLTSGGLTAVPPRRPRLFALDLTDDGGRLAVVQSAAVGALARAVGHRPERRAFWPHVTLARVRGPLDGPQGWPAAPPEPACRPFEGRVLTLYRSVLHPAGARYEPLARTELR